jgi:hypothetical protein
MAVVDGGRAKSSADVVVTCSYSARNLHCESGLGLNCVSRSASGVAEESFPGSALMRAGHPIYLDIVKGKARYKIACVAVVLAQARCSGRHRASVVHSWVMFDPKIR